MAPQLQVKMVIVGALVLLLLFIVRGLWCKMFFHYRLLMLHFHGEDRQVRWHKPWKYQFPNLNLSLSMNLWYLCPVYFTLIPRSELAGKALQQHRTLIIERNRFVIFLLLFFVLFGVMALISEIA